MAELSLMHGPIRALLGRARTDFSPALPTGILVKDEQFTLFESVGALEVCSTTSGWGPTRRLRNIDHGSEDG